MSDDHEHEETEPVEDVYIERETAPQQEYTMREVTIGFVVAIVGMAVVFGLPLVMA